MDREDFRIPHSITISLSMLSILGVSQVQKIEFWFFFMDLTEAFRTLRF